jgi:hypothetical protein
MTRFICIDLLNYLTDFDTVFLNRWSDLRGRFIYNMHNIVEKHFSISIAPVRSWGLSLVSNRIHNRSRIAIQLHFAHKSLVPMIHYFIAISKCYLASFNREYSAYLFMLTLHTTHLYPRGEADASQNFFEDVHILPKLLT